MKPITGETTFKEIRDLLEKEDKDFIAICKRIKEKKIYHMTVRFIILIFLWLSY